MSPENHPKLKLMLPWDQIDSLAQKQIKAALELEFLDQLVIMPDVHGGYSLPIGGVAIASKRVSPAWVGFDIGCGMCHFDTGLNADRFAQTELEDLLKEMQQQIPHGNGKHRRPHDYRTFKTALEDPKLSQELDEKAKLQLGTLGSGNHFIEVGRNLKGSLAVTIHSGSRGVGYRIAETYMKRFGDFLHTDSPSGQAYLQDMAFALQFGFDNRKAMMLKVLELMGLEAEDKALERGMINENHNHAEVLEGDRVLHRKGATPAEEGQLGVIPGNMRDGVIVTRGLGNAEFLHSASHGAGRVMSRKAAQKEITIPDFEATMQGIVARVNRNTLDEAPQAYKDLDLVIAAQEGLVVEVIDRVVPILNFKG